MRHMSVIFIVIMPLLLITLTLGRTEAADRRVLAEEFSQKTCTECPLAEAALDSVLKYDFGLDELAVISSLTDPFPPGANDEGISRQHYYPKTYNPPDTLYLEYWTPVVWFDGVDEQTGAPGGIDSLWAIYREKIQNRLVVPSPLIMDVMVEYGAKGDTGTVQVQLVATDVISYQDLHVRMTVVESGVDIGNRIMNHLLRDYFPDTLGVSLVISQGDTVTHWEEFVIDASWVVGRCDIVAFVQDDTTREVLQASRVPVLAPVPTAVDDLNITLSGDDVLMEWSSVTQDTLGNPLAVSHYNIYRDTLSFRDPGSDPFFSTTNTVFVDLTGVVGDPGRHYYFWVTAVAGSKESADSGGVGEFDIHLSAGK